VHTVYLFVSDDCFYCDVGAEFIDVSFLENIALKGFDSREVYKTWLLIIRRNSELATVLIGDSAWYVNEWILFI
jgi:hypothetical protein